MAFVGLEIGGTKLQMIVAETPFHVLNRKETRVEPAAGAEGIRQWIARELPDLIRGHDVRAVGVGFGGPVHWKTGTVAQSHQIAGWAGFPLAEWIRTMVDVPVLVDNDANVAALGEAWHGAGRAHDPVFYVTLGSGVGGGLVVGGRVYHGIPPGEAELGHLRLDRQGTTLESRCSGWAMNERVRQAVAAAPGTPLGRRVREDPGHEARHLAAALAEGDPLAQRLLEEWAEDFAFGLSHAVHLFHPEIVILGGGLAGVGEPLRAAVARHLPRHLMNAFQPGPKLALAALGRDAVPVGAIEMARWA